MEKRKAKSEVPVSINSRAPKRHNTMNDTLIQGSTGLVARRYLDDLPREILLNICEYFAEPWVLTDDLADWEVYTLDRESRVRQQTLFALTKTCRSLNQPATTVFYHCAHLPTYKSLILFACSLRSQPHLAQLVKQIACPSEVLMCIAYTFGTFQGSLQHPPSKTTLFQRSSAPLALNPRRRYHSSYICTTVEASVLRCILDRTPRLRALSVAMTKPWHMTFALDSLPLEHLRSLSLSMPLQPELYLAGRSSNWPILMWLEQATLGRHPALELLELINPRGKWIAHLDTVASGDASGPAGVEKYVRSLTTLARNGGFSAQWDLLSLQQRIFSPAHLRSLQLAGPSLECGDRFALAPAQQWNLHRFIATKGRGIQTLSLDWENVSFQMGLLGDSGLFTSLRLLPNLTHLTVSMQVLFRAPNVFLANLMNIRRDPEAGLRRLLPPLLRVLRINEYIPLASPPWADASPDDAQPYVSGYNNMMMYWIDELATHWLGTHPDRELHFKHFLGLERNPHHSGQTSRRLLRWMMGPLPHDHVGREFARVRRTSERDPNCLLAQQWTSIRHLHRHGSV